MAEEALAIRERLTPGSLDVAASLHSLGAIFYYQGDLATAMKYYLKSMAIQEQRAPDSLDLAFNLTGMYA